MLTSIFSPVLRAIKRAFCWAFNTVIDLCLSFLMWLLALIPETIREAIPTEFIGQIFRGAELFLPCSTLLNLFGVYMGWRLSVLVFRLLFRIIRG